MGDESNNKVMHDLLKANLERAGGTHKPCHFCTDQEEPVGSETYTEDQLQDAISKAVDAAVGPLNVRITELSATQEQAVQDKALEDAVAAATADANLRITELEAEIETLAMGLKAAEDGREELVAFLEGEVAVTAASERASERVAAVKATGLFDEAFVDARADKYAAMTDEAWAEKLEELEAAAEKRETKRTLKPGPLPTQPSAMQATVERESEASTSPTKKVMELAAAGVNLSAV